MNSQQLIKNVKRLYDEIYSQGNMRLCEELFDENLKLHDPAIIKNKSGLESFIESESQYQIAFPNKKVKIDDILVENDKVVVRWSSQGKHDGPLQGIPPTHYTFHINGISIYHFSNGKIIEIWQSWDRLSLLEQLGVLQYAQA